MGIRPDSRLQYNQLVKILKADKEACEPNEKEETIKGTMEEEDESGHDL